VFHRGLLTIAQVKAAMADAGVSVRSANAVA
jgi:imidazole glycerol phosphate synthase subunit HisF